MLLEISYFSFQQLCTPMHTAYTFMYIIPTGEISSTLRDTIRHDTISRHCRKVRQIDLYS
jgi:hypothetical protein